MKHFMLWALYVVHINSSTLKMDCWRYEQIFLVSIQLKYVPFAVDELVLGCDWVTGSTGLTCSFSTGLLPLTTGESLLSKSWLGDLLTTEWSTSSTWFTEQLASLVVGSMVTFSSTFSCRLTCLCGMTLSVFVRPCTLWNLRTRGLLGFLKHENMVEI